MLKFSIPENPNLNLIPKTIQKFKDNRIEISELIKQIKINDLNTNQFCFIIGLAAFEGNEFDIYFNLVKKFVLSRKRNDLDLLVIENNLHSVFLKKYETDYAYNKFYNFFSRVHNPKIKNNNLLKNEENFKNKIIFFIHEPILLAHIIPLFKMLKFRKTNNIEVSIASLHYNEKFHSKCKSVKVNYFVLNGRNLHEKLLELNNIASKFEHLIWVSVPIGLSFLRTYTNKITYWSHKFHPDIPKLKNYIGTFNEDKNFVFKNKNKWKNFRNDFEIENLGVQKEIWSIRKNNFGTFCREELINQKNFWEIIHIILSSNKSYTYFYCGHNPIHKHWCSELGIPIDQVQFLGWLEKPHLKLKEMAFLIDGLNLGHGYLGIEAMAAEVPIIFPEKKNSYSNVENYLIRTQGTLNKENDKNYLNRYSLVYSKENILKIVNDLISKEDYNQFYGSHYKKVVQNHPNESFEDFLDLL